MVARTHLAAAGLLLVLLIACAAGWRGEEEEEDAPRGNSASRYYRASEGSPGWGRASGDGDDDGYDNHDAFYHHRQRAHYEEPVHRRRHVYVRAGPQGPAGPQGAAGIDGRNGTDGQNGLPGRNGKNGLPGAAGINGTNGIDGRNGTDGLQGPAGSNGTAGPQGPAGACLAPYTVRETFFTIFSNCSLANPLAAGNECVVAKCNPGDGLILGSCSVTANAVLSNTPVCRDTLGNAIACEAFAADAAGWTCTAATGSGTVAVALCCAGSAPAPALQVLNFDDRTDASSLPVLNSEPSYGGFKWGGDNVAVFPAGTAALPSTCTDGSGPTGFATGVASPQNAIYNQNGQESYFCDDSGAISGTGGGFVVQQLSATPAVRNTTVLFTGYNADGTPKYFANVRLDYTSGPNTVTLVQFGRIYALSWVADAGGTAVPCLDTTSTPELDNSIVIDNIVFARYDTPATPVTCPS